MSLRQKIAAMLGAKSGAPAPVATVVPQPAPPQYPQPVAQPAPQRKYGDSMLMSEADFVAFGKKSIPYTTPAHEALATAALGGDPKALLQLLNEVTHMGTTYAVALAAQRAHEGLQADFGLLQDSMSSTFKSNTIDQLIANDQRYSDPTISTWAKSLISNAREIDANATPQDIKDFLDASFQSQGIPAFAQGTNTQGKSGRQPKEQQHQAPTTQEERWKMLFGDDPATPPQQTPVDATANGQPQPVVPTGVGGTPPTM